jgi:hypothetical protein
LTQLANEFMSSNRKKYSLNALEIKIPRKKWRCKSQQVTMSSWNINILDVPVIYPSSWCSDPLTTSVKRTRNVQTVDLVRYYLISSSSPVLIILVALHFMKYRQVLITDAWLTI